MRRVLVVGASGSGKSTAARRIAGRLGVPHVELDALQHGPGWTQRATFVADVEAATGGPAWVVDGNYSAVRALLWSRADTVVWLDLPRWLVESRVVRRTLVRLVLRTPLWNGNRERWRTVLHASHPIRWSWGKHPEYRRRYGALFDDPTFAHVNRVRLRSRADVRRFLADLPASPGAGGTTAP